MEPRLPDRMEGRKPVEDLLPAARASVGELVGQYSRGGHIVDIGCGDAPLTGHLAERYDITGVDSDEESLAAARGRFPRYRTHQDDVRGFAVSEAARKLLPESDLVLAFDIIEHLKRPDAVTMLQGLRAGMPPEHTVLALMPAAVPYSLDTIFEAAEVMRQGRRPVVGLFEHDHKMFGGARKYAGVFRQAGYQVAQRYRLNQVVGLEGDWQWRHDQPELEPENRSLEGRAGNRLGAYVARRTIDTYVASRQDGSHLTQRVTGALLVRANLLVAHPA